MDNVRKMRITFLGNFEVSYTSETHHANTLESLGHTVIRLQEGKANSSDILRHAIDSQLLVWVHTHGWETPVQVGHKVSDIFEALKARGIPTMTYHLDLWFGLDRQKDLKNDPFYKHIDHFFTVDKLMADWFNTNTSVKGHYLQAGVFDQDCYMARKLAPGNWYRDIAFVGSKRYHHEWPYRPQLIDWLQRSYGSNFIHVGGDGETGTIRGDNLNKIMGDVKIIVGDSLCLNFDYPHYWSDRVYETLGRGGFLIMPYVQGMGEHFEDGKHLRFYQYGDYNQLAGLIDYYIKNPVDREAIRIAGHEHVKANHTYVNRWQRILEVINA